MSTILEVEKLALGLPEHDRAKLAVSLLGSLPAVLADEDEGISEALKRGAAADADPTKLISLSELEERLRSVA
jgi:hypothetical protein